MHPWGGGGNNTTILRINHLVMVNFHSKCGLALQSTVYNLLTHRRRSCFSVLWNVIDLHFSLRSSVALYTLSDVSEYTAVAIFSGWMYGQSRTWTDPYTSRGGSWAWFNPTWYKLLGGKEISQTLLRLCPYLRWNHGQTIFNREDAYKSREVMNSPLFLQ